MKRSTSGLPALSGLADPVRARLYHAVCQSTAPIGRDEAAAAAGIGRPLAAYHLDKLVELGLLAATYQRPEGRGGPGAGRPAKFYARSAREFTVTVPPREYELAARLLVTAVESDSGGSSRVALREAAREFGAGLGVRSRPDTPGRAACWHAIVTVLHDHGFEPWRAGDGSVKLRNCPFHQLARQHTDVVCGMNLALIQGLVAGLGDDCMQADLEPRAGQCCVVIRDTVGKASLS